MTFSAFASNFKLRPRLLLLPPPAMTMKLDVIFDKALLEIPSISATLNEGKYLFCVRFATTALNLSFSFFSEGKNWNSSDEDDEELQHDKSSSLLG